LGIAGRNVCGALFLFAGLQKLRSATSGAAMLTTIGVPDKVSNAVVRAIALFEVALGCWLLTDAQVPASIVTAIVVLCGLTLVLGLAAWKKYEGACGCFGEPEAPIGINNFAFNGGMLCMLSAAYVTTHLAPKATFASYRLSWQALAVTIAVGMSFIAILSLVRYIEVFLGLVRTQQEERQSGVPEGW
jgi:hypothetical protein